jgi:hypothetical protein
LINVGDGDSAFCLHDATKRITTVNDRHFEIVEFIVYVFEVESRIRLSPSLRFGMTRLRLRLRLRIKDNMNIRMFNLLISLNYAQL